jgi:ABC-type amino acid transport substrate-binding protein
MCFCAVFYSIPQPPFVYYNDNPENEDDNFTGLTIDIARLIEIELNCKFKFILGDPGNPYASRGAIDALTLITTGESLEGRADVAGGALHPKTEYAYQYFTLPFYDSGFQLFVRVPVPEASVWSFFGTQFTCFTGTNVQILTPVSLRAFRVISVGCSDRRGA